MGVDFTAVMSHRLPPHDLQRIPSLVSTTTAPRLADAIRDLVTILLPLYPAMDSSVEWLFDETARMELRAPEQVWSRQFAIGLEGPAGLLLDVSPHLCTVWNVTRWGTFLAEPHIHQPLRRVCYELAQILGAPLAIYLPDSGFPISAVLDCVYTNQSIGDVLAWLQQHYGAAAESLEALETETAAAISSESGYYNGYYIDTFSDMFSSSQE